MFNAANPEYDAWPHTRKAHNNVVWRLVASGISSFLRSIAGRRDLRRATHELESMDDHMLKDIGIGRSEIMWAVRYGRASGGARGFSTDIGIDCRSVKKGSINPVGR